MKTTGNVNHNHCVKADPNDPFPFCYTTDPNVRYEYCDCEDISNDYSYYQDNDGQYKDYGGGAYGVNNGYNQYGQYGGANGGYNYAPGGVNYPSNSQYYDPRVMYPNNPFVSGWPPRPTPFQPQGFCRVSTTVKGIVNPKGASSNTRNDTSHFSINNWKRFNLSKLDFKLASSAQPSNGPISPTSFGR